MFGMHPNADISFAQAETYACLNTLLALQPRQVGIAAASVEEVTNRLAQDMLSTIPRTFDLAAMQRKYFVEILHGYSFTRINGYSVSASLSLRGKPPRIAIRVTFFVLLFSFFLTAHFLRSRSLFRLASLKTREKDNRDSPYVSNTYTCNATLVFRSFVLCQTNTR